MKIKEQQSDKQIHTPVFTYLSTLERDRGKEQHEKRERERKKICI